MKRIVLGTLALMFGIAGYSFSASLGYTVPVTVTVKEMFSLVVDKPSLDFGTSDVGKELLPQIVKCVIATNHGVPWNVALQADPLTEPTGQRIPAEDFRYFHTFDNPDGNEIPPANGTTLPVPAIEQTAFSAGPNIFNANTTEFGLGFIVIIPQAQKGGVYTSTIRLRLVDGI